MAIEHITLGPTSPAAERALFGPPSWAEMDTETNATVTATKAGVASKQHLMFKVVYSFSGAPATALELDIKDGASVIARFQIPASLTAPVPLDFGMRPMRATAGNDLVATIGAAGSGIVCTVWFEGDTIAAA